MNKTENRKIQEQNIRCNNAIEMGDNNMNFISSQPIILPPSPTAINENRSNKIPIESNNRPTPKIQNSNAMFDPNNASPASDFMNILKLRMDVYFGNIKERCVE